MMHKRNEAFSFHQSSAEDEYHRQTTNAAIDRGFDSQRRHNHHNGGRYIDLQDEARDDDHYHHGSSNKRKRRYDDDDNHSDRDDARYHHHHHHHHQPEQWSRYDRHRREHSSRKRRRRESRLPSYDDRDEKSREEPRRYDASPISSSSSYHSTDRRRRRSRRRESGHSYRYDTGSGRDHRRRRTRYSSRRRSPEYDDHSRRRMRNRRDSHRRDRSADDEQGHIIFRLGDDITDRFKILKFMGEGTFAKVLECWDRRRETRVAIKVVRAISKYSDAAEIEIDILKDIRKRDPDGIHNCIEYISSFRYKKHICIVFPLYGMSLYDFLKKNRYRGFSLDHVRDLAFRVIKGIAFIHSFDLIHTDLKPENILLVDSDFDIVDLPEDKRKSRYRESSRESSCHSTTTTSTATNSSSSTSGVSRTMYMIPKSTDTRIIDFGSATYEHQHHSSIISTRHYRAPEVILGLGWSFPADMWSVGCILVELLTGDAMFQTHENREHLAMMERILGTLPKSMTSRSQYEPFVTDSD